MEREDEGRPTTSGSLTDGEVLCLALSLVSSENQHRVQAILGESAQEDPVIILEQLLTILPEAEAERIAVRLEEILAGLAAGTLLWPLLLH